jgi:acetylglutamate kinase
MLPRGFRYAGVAAGIKPSRPDVALVYSDAPCDAAGVFTTNRAKAAPILDAEPRLPASGIHAVVVNSGNANALTGAAGVEAVVAVREAVAAALGIAPGAVVCASTGVIGVRLPVGKLVAVMPRLVAALGDEPEAAADAILTTDTGRKLASRVVELGGKPVAIAAIAKGSGMIAPQLATVIAVIATDCAIDPEPLRAALAAAAADTFNHLTIDNETSTNDCVLALANAHADNPRIAATGPDLATFTAALRELCRDLARAIAADGEGATKRIEVRVAGAPEPAIASELARAVAGSTLVKAAMFGADPNWGRVIATIGARAGACDYPIDPCHAAVALQGVPVYDGGPLEFDRAALRTRLRDPDVAIDVDLRGGPASATAWGCDLGYDYVKINADYASQIIETADGGVARDDRFTTYSPKLKVALLVQALGYISRFRGQRCVIACSGAAIASEALRRALCEDVLLLREVGLAPIVVHGGGAELDRARAKAPDDRRVAEMVLTGSVNAELVSLLNRRGGSSAVGLSGKDGGMLRVGHARSDAPAAPIADAALVELMLGKGYVPVIAPVGLGDHGEPCELDADVAAAALAVALHAHKLIYLCGAAGILAGGELVSELDRSGLAAMLDSGAIAGGMAVKARSIARALDGGVAAAHILDGRMPHSALAELFTDSGVGTVVRQLTSASEGPRP